MFVIDSRIPLEATRASSTGCRVALLRAVHKAKGKVRAFAIAVNPDHHNEFGETGPIPQAFLARWSTCLAVLLARSAAAARTSATR